MKVLFIEADQQMACKKYDLLGFGARLLPTVQMMWGDVLLSGCVFLFLCTLALKENRLGKRKKKAAAPPVVCWRTFMSQTAIVAN